MLASNWSAICRPKEEGRVGFRNIHEINQAASIKLSRDPGIDALLIHYGQLGWRIIISSPSIWEARALPMDSFVWKDIAKVRMQALVHMYHQDLTGTHRYGLLQLLVTYSSVFAWNIARTPAPLFPLANVIWFPFHIPKIVMFSQSITWELLTNCLVEEFFQGQESIQHLFFSWSYSSYMWKLCKLKLGWSQ